MSSYKKKRNWKITTKLLLTSNTTQTRKFIISCFNLEILQIRLAVCCLWSVVGQHSSNWQGRTKTKTWRLKRREGLSTGYRSDWLLTDIHLVLGVASTGFCKIMTALIICWLKQIPGWSFSMIHCSLQQLFPSNSQSLKPGENICSLQSPTIISGLQSSWDVFI